MFETCSELFYPIVLQRCRWWVSALCAEYPLKENLRNTLCYLPSSWFAPRACPISWASSRPMLRLILDWSNLILIEIGASLKITITTLEFEKILEALTVGTHLQCRHILKRKWIQKPLYKTKLNKYSFRTFNKTWQNKVVVFFKINLNWGLNLS